jgi:replicative DNA helicase
MKTAPRFIEGERAILGAMFFDDDAVSAAVEALRPDDFAYEQHRLIYSAMVALHEHEVAIDWITITAELKKRGTLEAIGGPAFLAELADSIPSARNVGHYIKKVLDKSLRRQAIATADEIAAAAYEENTDIGEFIDSAEQRMFSLGERLTHTGWHDMRGLVLAGLSRIEMLYERKEAITGIPSGFRELDLMTAGFQPTDLIIVAGRPSMGKTSLALNVALHAAIDAGVPTAVFSMEMGKDQLALRMLCSQAHVNLTSVRTGFLADADWGRLSTAAGLVGDAPIYIDDEPAQKPMAIRSKARRMKRELNLGLIVIDYLQLMRANRRSDSREKEIAEISGALKALAKELDVPVIALSQLNRKVEERPNKRPQLSDLRESGAIEQDADVIIFIYRDEVYHKSDDNPKKGEAEIIIGKQRNGPVGMVTVAFKAQWSTFLPLTLRDDEPAHLEVM